MASDSNDQMDTTPITLDSTPSLGPESMDSIDMDTESAPVQGPNPEQQLAHDPNTSEPPPDEVQDQATSACDKMDTMLTQFYRLGVVNSRNEVSHFEVIETRMDGNCLFRAISQALLGHQGAHERIREEVVNHILEPANWPTFVNDITAQSEDYGRRPSEHDEDETEEEALKRRYGRYMHRLGKYGTFVELIAASELYEFNPLVVRMMSTELFNILPTRETPHWPVTFHFFYSGIGANSGHFENLEPASPHPNVEPVTFDMESGFYNLVAVNEYCMLIRQQPPTPDPAGDAAQENGIRLRSGKVLKSGVADQGKKGRKKKESKSL